jgi:hypothetical protein
LNLGILWMDEQEVTRDFMDERVVEKQGIPRVDG